MNQPNRPVRSVVEEAIALLRQTAPVFEPFLPCRITLHLPDPRSQEKPVLEITLKVKSEGQEIENK